MGKIYLVRHGETLWNSTMRFQGATDIELSAKGLLQAEQLAAGLKDKKIDAVYASDLKRAIKTASFLAKEKGLTVNSEPGIKEMCFGEWEGLTRSQIDEKWPGMLEVFLKDPGEFESPGGESFVKLQQRSCLAFYNIAKKHKQENILIVSHGGTIRAILADLLGMNLAKIWSLRQDNTGMNIIVEYDGNYVVNLLNSTLHLR